MTLTLLLMSLLAVAEEPAAPPAPEPAPREAEAPLPVVQIQAMAGQRFSVIIDGQPVGVASHETPLTLTTLSPGPHSAEFRTEDNLVIWARGVIELVPSDELILSLSEGRPVVPTGRTGAWRATSSTAPPPRKAVRKPDREAP